MSSTVAGPDEGRWVDAPFDVLNIFFIFAKKVIIILLVFVCLSANNLK